MGVSEILALTGTVLGVGQTFANKFVGSAPSMAKVSQY